jgi:putative tryptophan/tyrosine transport system substrate-binding protein
MANTDKDRFSHTISAILAVSMRRREFIAALGGTAVAWPLSTRAQQPALPVIGFLISETSMTWREEIAAFQRGLAETGYVEGSNVAIEYRWAESHNDRLPALVAELVRRPVAVIVTPGTPAMLAAKAATQTIPIVFLIGSDPIKVGLVDSLNRPSGNLTGVAALIVDAAALRLQLLHELVPAALFVGYLRNSKNSTYAATEIKELQKGAEVLGLRLLPLDAGSQGEIEAAFAILAEQQAHALLVGADPFLIGARKQIIALAARQAIPAIHPFREDAEAGGLVAYGPNNSAMFRMVGGYTGRILRGDKVADLPVQQVTKIEMVINLKTAKALGITFPLSFLGRADEVIA